MITCLLAFDEGNVTECYGDNEEISGCKISKNCWEARQEAKRYDFSPLFPVSLSHI